VKAQALIDNCMGSYMSRKKTMEINLDNVIMEELRKIPEADKNDKSRKRIFTKIFINQDVSFGLGEVIIMPSSIYRRLHIFHLVN